MGSWRKNVRWLLIIGYVVLILSKTIIGRQKLVEPIFKPLFWEIRNGYWEDIVLNILLFIPFGFLVGGWKGILVGFLLSCFIEINQYCCWIGYCEMDDLLNNTIGSGIGAFLGRILREYKKVKKQGEQDVQIMYKKST